MRVLLVTLIVACCPWLLPSAQAQTPLQLATAPESYSPPLALPLPDDIYAIREADGGVGMAWRQWMRGALEGAFGKGYVIVDCARHEDGQWRYLLVA